LKFRSSVCANEGHFVRFFLYSVEVDPKMLSESVYRRSTQGKIKEYRKLLNADDAAELHKATDWQHKRCRDWSIRYVAPYLSAFIRQRFDEVKDRKDDESGLRRQRVPERID